MIEDDVDLQIISAKMPDDFQLKINFFLQQGGWRVACTEMSVTDHHYYAMIVKRAGDNND